MAVLTFLSLPFSMPLAHRFGYSALKKVIFAGLAVYIGVIATFASPAMKPFDRWHPKRLFVHQTTNVTSGEWYMNLGSADPAPGCPELVQDVHAVLGVPNEPPKLLEMSDRNPVFDILYPVSDFITPYQFRLPTPAGGSNSSAHVDIKARDEVLDLDAGTRSITLHIRHPGLVSVSYSGQRGLLT